MKTVTIVIPALHRPDLTSRCLHFLSSQTLPPAEWEVVVVENEARPETILPDPLPPNTSRIELPTNEGTTGSINRAVAATRSRYVLLLNNDIELEPDYLEKLVAVMEQQPGLGFATGKLLRATQRTHLDGAGDAVLIGGGAYRLGNMNEDRGQFDEQRKVLSGCGAAILYRREAFEAAGRLDETFFAYSDDLDLALRAHLAGYEGMYVPRAVAHHIGSATLGAALHPRVVEWLTRNQLFLIWKDYPRTVRRHAFPRIAFYQFLWLLHVARSGHIVSYVKGIRDALRHRPLMRQKHRELMATRKIGDDRFLELLRYSEQQVAAWHYSQPAHDRSSLLNAYFRIFRVRGGPGPAAG